MLEKLTRGIDSGFRYFQLAMCPSICRLRSCSCSKLSAGQGGDAVHLQELKGTKYCSSNLHCRTQPCHAKGEHAGSIFSIAIVSRSMCLHGGDSMSSNISSCSSGSLT
jgi:hypothetical protein